MAGDLRDASVIILLTGVVCCVAENVLVETSQGKVAGYTDQTTSGREFYAFNSIPYAKPPTGKLRFKDPEPLSSWEGTHDATKPGPTCPQIPYLLSHSKGLIGEEDCLSLDVYTPKIEGSARLPVMFFIHGGCYLLGGSQDANPFSMLEEDIVLVIVQYRLGALGFLSTEDEFAPGNLGLKDQLLALRWVQQNIEKFGGDSSSVTIFGESVGASTVQFLIFMKQSRGLFHRAIMESGTMTSPWAFTENPGQTAVTIGERLGCPIASSELLVNCLQGKTFQELTEIFSMFFYTGFPIYKLGVYVDGSYVTDHPALLMRDGAFADMDLMIGVNKDEGALEASIMFSDDDQFKGLQENFLETAPLALFFNASSHEDQQLAARVFHYYLGEDFKLVDSARSYAKMVGEQSILIPSDNAVLTHIRRKGSATRVYKYDFEYRGEQSFLDHFQRQHLPDQSVAQEWACHADELAYLFPGGEYFMHPHTRENDKKMSRIMVKLWTNFATYGDPTPDDSLGFKWEPATESRFRHLAIKEHPAMEEYKREKNRQFWNSLPVPENILLYPNKFPGHKSYKTQKQEL